MDQGADRSGTAGGYVRLSPRGRPAHQVRNDHRALHDGRVLHWNEAAGATTAAPGIPADSTRPHRYLPRNVRPASPSRWTFSTLTPAQICRSRAAAFCAVGPTGDPCAVRAIGAGAGLRGHRPVRPVRRHVPRDRWPIPCARNELIGPSECVARQPEGATVSPLADTHSDPRRSHRGSWAINGSGVGFAETAPRSVRCRLQRRFRIGV
jgi:hypothetical protein